MSENDSLELLNRVAWAMFGVSVRVDGKRVGWVTQDDDGSGWRAIVESGQSETFPTRAQAIAWLVVTRTRAAWDLLTVANKPLEEA